MLQPLVNLIVLLSSDLQFLDIHLKKLFMLVKLILALLSLFECQIQSLLIAELVSLHLLGKFTYDLLRLGDDKLLREGRLLQFLIPWKQLLKLSVQLVQNKLILHEDEVGLQGVINSVGLLIVVLIIVIVLFEVLMVGLHNQTTVLWWLTAPWWQLGLWVGFWDCFRSGGLACLLVWKEMGFFLMESTTSMLAMINITPDFCADRFGGVFEKSSTTSNVIERISINRIGSIIQLRQLISLFQILYRQFIRWQSRALLQIVLDLDHISTIEIESRGWWVKQAPPRKSLIL